MDVTLKKSTEGGREDIQRRTAWRSGRGKEQDEGREGGEERRVYGKQLLTT